MRGKVRGSQIVVMSCRITPAYAGKRSSFHTQTMTLRDHPRVCGEKLCTQAEALGIEGSPPRVRGKGDFPLDGAQGQGITPAYAGKRVAGGFRPGTTQDHPRVCGEKMVSMIPHRRSRGLPPRVRGKVLGTLAAAHDAGITPACAGKRHLIRIRIVRHRDHPRVCGEKISSRTSHILTIGSPPRVRGKEREQPHL